ncbi:MAG: YggS family pyridoxal phosphate-dependent enzyme [Syntrophobacterales bacterium]|jgi:pyridoxal phosphate enzyme (YggS family)|nr:YggS family pyridoxal phosphate-dependent enzyme [Syntrophobacterales bacterium]
MNIEDTIRAVRERISAAACRAGRAESEVLLIGVTKRVDSDKIQEAVRAGLTDFGENYIQEAKKKIEGFEEKVCWHMIGHIQTNKLKYIPPLFDYVHSVDRLEIAEGLDKYGKPMNILFELNLSREVSKHGTEEEGLRRMLKKVVALKHVKPVGLMTMAPFVDDPEEVRGVFASLRNILGRANREFGLDMKELSMGMSSDFEVAIEEGSTMVRVGTAIFGERT